MPIFHNAVEEMGPPDFNSSAVYLIVVIFFYKTDVLPRLGVMAVACGDGLVRILRYHFLSICYLINVFKRYLKAPDL